LLKTEDSAEAGPCRQDTNCLRLHDGFLEVLGRPESNLLAGLHLDGFAGCRVATHPCRALAHLQDAEARVADDLPTSTGSIATPSAPDTNLKRVRKPPPSAHKPPQANGGNEQCPKSKDKPIVSGFLTAVRSSLATISRSRKQKKLPTGYKSRVRSPIARAPSFGVRPEVASAKRRSFRSVTVKAGEYSTT
jgi:hypothetical protein